MTQVNKGGRPRLPEGKALSKKFFCRLTPTDFEALQSHCYALDLTPSQLIRRFLQAEGIINGRR